MSPPRRRTFFFPCLSPGGDRPDESRTPGPVVSHAFILLLLASRPSRAIRDRFSLERLVNANRRLFVLSTRIFLRFPVHRRAGYPEKSPSAAAEIAAAAFHLEFGDTLKVRFFPLLLSCPKRSNRLTQTVSAQFRSHNLSLQVHNVGFSHPPSQRTPVSSDFTGSTGGSVTVSGDSEISCWERS